MKRIKQTILPLLALTFVLLSACNETTQQVESSNPNLAIFYLVNDSVEGIENVKFVIDNETGKIYNPDSADFGITVDSAYPHIVGETALSEIIINDDIIYTSKDSVYIDFTKPVTIRTRSSDEEYTKEYSVTVSVHQVNPDTFVWKGVNHQIYTETPTMEHTVLYNDSLYLFTSTGTVISCKKSADAAQWTANPTQNLPSSANIHHIIAGEKALYYADATTLYTSTDGINWRDAGTSGGMQNLLFTLNGHVFGQNGSMPGAKLMSCPENDLATWTQKAILPVEFPQSGMTSCVASTENGNNRVFIFGGRDSSGKLLKSLWSTDGNGSYWVDLTVGTDSITPREGAAIAQYANGLMVFGGKNDDGLITNRQMFSPDYGLNWTTADSISQLPQTCVNRHSAALIANSTGYIYLIGGQTIDGTYIRNAWRGIRYASIPGFKD